MAAISFTTTTHTVMGKLDKCKKMVSTVLTTADTGTDPTVVAIKPLAHLTAFVPVYRTQGAISGTIFSTPVVGSGTNTILITPPASIAGAIIQIISIGN